LLIKYLFIDEREPDNLKQTSSLSFQACLVTKKK